MRKKYEKTHKKQYLQKVKYYKFKNKDILKIKIDKMLET